MTWSCEAYGPDGARVGALCFVSERGARSCLSPAQCGAVMGGERRRVFRAINELAAGGDLAAAELADLFAAPGELLGGPS